jgi:tetratricopeptide (TPR) repeat protein
LAIAFARPEVNDLFPKLWARATPTGLGLRRLSPKPAEKLVRSVLGDDADAAIVERIVAQADGNAFVLEELVRAAATGEAQIPETALGMVEARIGKLDEESRRVLRAASVFGQTFWEGAVVALLDAHDRAAQIGALLEVLERGEWITSRAEPTVRGETEYGFRHSLVREAAYAMLTDEDRKLGHALAGTWLDASGGADAAALAEHFHKGGENARAAQLFARAAAGALEASSLSDAIALAARGAACGAAGELLGRLRLVESEARSWRGENAAALEHAEEAATLLPKGTAQWAEAMTRAGVAALRIGERERGLAAFARLEASELGAGALEHVARLATTLYLYGMTEHADALLVRAEDALRLGANAALEGAVFRARSARSEASGDPAGASEASEGALAAYERAGRTRFVVNQWTNLGYYDILLGRSDRAVDRLRAACASAERFGMHSSRAVAIQNLGWALGRQGRFDEAIAIEEQAIRLFEEQADRRLESGSRLYLARIALAAGQIDRAEAEGARALTLAESAPRQRAAALAVMAEAHLRKGDRAAALARAREASAWLETHGDEEEAYVRLACAEIEHAAGEANAAHEQIRAARDAVLARAEKIGSPDARTGFLTRVPEHARTLALASEWHAT